MRDVILDEAIADGNGAARPFGDAATRGERGRDAPIGGRGTSPAT